MILPDGASRVHQTVPYIAEYANFLSVDQCHNIIKHCTQLVFTQGCVRSSNETKIDTNIRLASTHIITQLDDENLTSLTQNIVDWLKLPNSHYVENGLIVHYPPGGEFKIHTDQVTNTTALRLTTSRVATVIVYLNDNFDGGYTVFPSVKVSVKPEVGKALLFLYNYDGPYLNKLTVHAGTKVKGNKFILVFFIRDKEYPDELRATNHY